MARTAAAEFLDFLGSQRWFAGKARTVTGVDTIASVPLVDAASAELVRVFYADGGDETYFVAAAAGDGGVSDALTDERVCRRLLEIVERGETVSAGTKAAGVLRGLRSSQFDMLRGSPSTAVPVRAMAHDQSNSAVVFGDRLFLKFFRKIEPGSNPDLEIARYLTERTAFTRLPRLAGAIEFQPVAGPPMTLATLQELVPNEGDAWTAMLREVRSALEAAKPQALDQIELLGRRTAELHLALASSSDDSAFAPVPLTIDDCEALAARLRRTAETVFETLRRSSTELTLAIAAQAAELCDRGPSLVDRFASTLAVEPQCTKTRIHGDYHLGQVLCQGNDFIILDFEGEPARSLAERRAKDSPLRDVAGMLRSFGYVAYAGLFAVVADNANEFARLEPIAKSWQQQSSSAYLRGYFAHAKGASFLPADEAQLAALLDFFVVEKALYEVLYEVNNRPAWLRIPLTGILALV